MASNGRMWSAVEPRAGRLLRRHSMALGISSEILIRIGASLSV